jgi:ATP-binding cassette, subfamily B, bacterial
MKYFGRVFTYLRPYWPLAIVSVILIFVGGVIGLATPWPLKILVDNVLQDKPLPGILETWFGGLDRYTLLYVAVFSSFFITLLVYGVAVVDRYVNTKLDQRMALDLRSDLFEHAQKLSMAYYDKRRTGHLIFVINSQGESVSRLLMTIPPVAQSLITLIGVVILCWRIDHQLTVIALSIAPLLGIATHYYMKNVQPRLVKVRSLEGDALAIIHEAITMMRVIVAFGRERFEQARFREQGERAAVARVDITVRQALFSMLIASILGGGTSFVMALGFEKALQGTITIGSLLVVLAYIGMVYQPMATISNTIGSLQEVFVNLEIAFNLLDTEPEVQDAPDAIKITGTSGRITFEDVHFAYEGRKETLDGISFDAAPGQIVAIVGHTGAGKTTLMSLIPRFYDVNQGRVLIDGRDVRSIAIRSLRDQISLVLQEPLLFSGPIVDNIRYGRPEATMEEVMEAAKAANAHDFITALPDGYNTLLGERGAKLSGGERQRISVARAFIKNAPILILDEPTSSVDTKTENVILDALDKLMVGRTTFIIAHRLSTIRQADIIIVMERGRIIEHGPAEELLAKDGTYRRLYDLQVHGIPYEMVRALQAADEVAETEG